MATENILLFIPNIIGYFRIFLMLLSFYFMPSNYLASTCCYVISGFLDALDGYAARYFNQGTKFGALLDQLTDRCGTAGLCMTLCYFYPDYMIIFQLSTVIDISCHWMFFYSSVLQKKSSHKFVDLSWNPVLQLYYSSKFVLFLLCVGNETFYTTLYLLHFTQGILLGGVSLFKVLCCVSAPIAILKSFISLLHGYVACRNIIIVDEKEKEMFLTKK